MSYKLRVWLWSLRNWVKGYKFGPVQRFRCCDHTTPYHYTRCRNFPWPRPPVSSSRDTEETTK